MAAINFKAGFDSWIANHQKVWKHDRNESLGASEAFGCLRKAWYSRNGAVVDPDRVDSWGALIRGDVMERHFVEPVVKWFIDQLPGNSKLIWGGDDQQTFIDGRLSATPDGLIVGADDDSLALYGIPSLSGSGCFAFEIKSIDPRVSLKEEKAIHHGQTQVQMGLIRKLTRHKPNFAVIIYVNASFYDDIELFVVPFNQKTFEAAEKRAKAVYSIKNPVEILCEGKIDGSCDLCKFTVACAQTNEVYTPQDGKANSKEGTSLALLEEFEALARRERDASAAKKVTEVEHKSASEDLKQWFRDIGVKWAESIDGNLKASISWIKGRKTYDNEALYAAAQAAGVDIEKFAKEGQGYDRLTIREKGASKADEE